MDTPTLQLHDPDAPPRLEPRPTHRRAVDEGTILDALKRALAEPGEHRLYRSGKLPGLFASRAGASGEAAASALARGFLELVRTEAKGKLIFEWVRATPAAVEFVNEHDSPKAALRELRDAIGAARSGVPTWMDDARRELTEIADRFDSQARAMMQRLDLLADRVDAALRRVEASGPQVPDPVRATVPWGEDALEYLDRRSDAGAAGPCPLGELFSAVTKKHPALTVPDFHAGLRRLHDIRGLNLTAGVGDLPDPEFAVFVGSTVCGFATR